MEEKRKPRLRLRSEIKAFAQEMERRMRGRKQEIAEGDIPHWRQTAAKELVECARHDLDQLALWLVPGQDVDAECVLNDAADAANYLMFAAFRLTGEG